MPKQTQLLLPYTTKFAQFTINELRTMNNELITNKPKQTQFQRQKMAAEATNRNTWKTKAEYSTIAMQSLKTMNEEKYE